MGQGAADEGVLELGPSGRLRVVLGVVAVLGVVVAVLLVLVIGSADGDVWRLIVFPVLQLIVGVGPIVVVHLRTTVRIDSTGITISGGHRQYRGSWAWPEILEVAMVRQGSWAIAVRPRGSVWDAPGPQSPATVTVPFRDRAARVRRAAGSASCASSTACCSPRTVTDSGRLRRAAACGPTAVRSLRASLVAAPFQHWSAVVGVGPNRRLEAGPRVTRLALSQCTADAALWGSSDGRQRLPEVAIERARGSAL